MVGRGPGLRTTVLEFGLYRNEYEAFVAALAAEGLEARLEQPEERRSVEQIAVEVGIWIGDQTAGMAFGALVTAIGAAAKKTISEEKGRRKGPAGQVAPDL